MINIGVLEMSGRSGIISPIMGVHELLCITDTLYKIKPPQKLVALQKFCLHSWTLLMAELLWGKLNLTNPDGKNTQ